jgi:hypothetical protein
MALRPLAHGKALAARIAAGERVGLLVVALHDWDAGRWFDGRPEVARVVLPADLPVEGASWACCLALDCVVCGSADEATFYAACAAIADHGAASVWGEFSDGFRRLDRAGRCWYADEGPLPANKLGAALRDYRTAATMTGQGFYRSRIFDGIRDAMRRELSEALAE